MFKITAEEKRLILRRRKVNSGNNYTEDEIRSMIKKHYNDSKRIKTGDYIEFLGYELEKRNVSEDVPENLQSACYLLFKLENAKYRLLDDLREGKEDLYENNTYKLIKLLDEVI